MGGNEEVFGTFLALKGLQKNAMPSFYEFNKTYAKEISNKIHKTLYNQMPFFPDEQFRLIDIRPTFEIETYFLSTIESSVNPLTSSLKAYGFEDQVVILNNYIRDTISVTRPFGRSFIRTKDDAQHIITQEVFDSFEKVTRLMKLELNIGSKIIKSFPETASVRIGWKLFIFEYSDFSDVIELMGEKFWHNNQKL